MDANETHITGTATWKRSGEFFTAPLDSGLLAAELYTGEPVRHGNAYPHQRNYHGYYWMASTQDHVWHESLLERSALMWLDHMADVVAVSSQPVKLADSKGVMHYPDLLVLDSRGVQTMYDVKPSGRLTPKVRAQFDWTRDMCASVGWDYRVITELSHQHHVNLNWLAQFRQPGHHPGAEAEQDLLDAMTPDWTLADAFAHVSAPSAPHARSSVFHLLWTGALACDMNTRFSERTPIRLTNRGPARLEFPHAFA